MGRLQGQAGVRVLGWMLIDMLQNQGSEGEIGSKGRQYLGFIC